MRKLLSLWRKESKCLNKKNEGFNLEELEKALKKAISIPFKLECNLNDLKEISISFETICLTTG